MLAMIFVMFRMTEKTNALGFYLYWNNVYKEWHELKSFYFWGSKTLHNHKINYTHTIYYWSHILINNVFYLKYSGKVKSQLNIWFIYSEHKLQYKWKELKEN